MTAAITSIDEVVDLLRALRLPHMRNSAPDLLATAKAQRWEPAEAMRALLAEELGGRQRSSIRSPRKAAGFSHGKTFETWEDTASSIAAPTQRALRTLEWIDRHENLVVCGPSGSGKTHFLEGLGHAPKRGARSPIATAPTTPSAGPSAASGEPTSSSSTTSGCCRSALRQPRRSTA